MKKADSQQKSSSQPDLNPTRNRKIERHGFYEWYRIGTANLYYFRHGIDSDLK